MTAEPKPASTPLTADDLVSVVCAVPGVRGIEPGIATTLRAIDARIRRSQADAHYGVILDRGSGTVIVEIGLHRTAPVRSIVADVQRTVRAAVRGHLPEGTDVMVRVQSLG
ncbi:hypothetical protein [Brachybacterium hainanense]|uniref:Asp23/Gls24 family envelope stress response protein n=1 Tax=Brachybacterium hainanense TaxID=1541174 RepID=A0ABV6RDU1_9MICO